jgi:hypothetical protein
MCCAVFPKLIVVGKAPLLPLPRHFLHDQSPRLLALSSGTALGLLDTEVSPDRRRSPRRRFRSYPFPFSYSLRPFRRTCRLSALLVGESAPQARRLESDLHKLIAIIRRPSFSQRIVNIPTLWLLAGNVLAPKFPGLALKQLRYGSGVFFSSGPPQSGHIQLRARLTV